jgi:hypothetical protein
MVRVIWSESYVLPADMFLLPSALAGNGMTSIMWATGIKEKHTVCYLERHGCI